MRSYSSSRRKDPLRIILGFSGVLFIVFSVVMLISSLASSRQQSGVYPAGLSVEGIPLGGLARSEAEDRLNMAFSQPIELRYNGARMQFQPADLGFSLDVTATLDQLEQSLPRSVWWQTLWGKSVQASQDIPAQSSVDEAVLRAHLQAAIPPRYDQTASAAMPILYTTNFTPGEAGRSMDLDQAVVDISAALRSPAERLVELRVSQTAALPLDPRNLEIFLKQTISLEGFDGLAEVYLRALNEEEQLHFAIRDEQPVPVDVAYTGASTIKIPIMVSVLSRTAEPTPELALGWLERMMVDSNNPPADALIRTYLEENTGPLLLTADMQSLGYGNTFLAGYFYQDAPLLQRFNTPANTRTDIDLDPDDYNQTVPSEIGDLLSRIYRCALGNGAQDSSPLFQQALTQTECQLMLDLMGRNQIGTLIEAGLPPEGSVAHKHGWTSDQEGLFRTLSDAGIISSLGGDYVLIIFINSSQQLIFSEGNRLFARLSQSIYNSFNLENQAAWLAN